MNLNEEEEEKNTSEPNNQIESKENKSPKKIKKFDK